MTATLLYQIVKPTLHEQTTADGLSYRVLCVDIYNQMSTRKLIVLPTAVNLGVAEYPQTNSIDCRGFALLLLQASAQPASS